MSRGQAKFAAFVSGFVLFLFGFIWVVGDPGAEDYSAGLCLLLVGATLAIGGLYWPMGSKHR
jgi:hypothetical protein